MLLIFLEFLLLPENIFVDCNFPMTARSEPATPADFKNALALFWKKEINDHHTTEWQEIFNKANQRNEGIRKKEFLEWFETMTIRL